MSKEIRRTMTEAEFIDFLCGIANGLYRNFIKCAIEDNVPFSRLIIDVVVRLWLDGVPEDENTKMLRMWVNGYLATGQWGFLASGLHF